MGHKPLQMGGRVRPAVEFTGQAVHLPFGWAVSAFANAATG